MTDTDRDAVAEGQILRPSQLRRVEALKTARLILEDRTGGVFAGVKAEAKGTVEDLLTLAGWVLDGLKVDAEDPIEGWTSADQSAYNTGWNDHRAAVLDTYGMDGAQAAVQWSRKYPASMVPRDVPTPDEERALGVVDPATLESPDNRLDWESWKPSTTTKDNAATDSALPMAAEDIAEEPPRLDV